ncbi:class I SAM-dependent methyltransferase [Actinomadura sp. HBU206391]|uniref:class I SAM-dependent methyltransferase n=1 Tax=Actinomadura sp. HBU206391 TaxID=2731692 RepID=UPI00164FCC58|nr:methyltransferase domain-containing protein [Actinomadura sp. HBU206391]MBC6460113.1 class I SAM-dependent methyltransferase [Actinomadura sp. HBU206391]
MPHTTRGTEAAVSDGSLSTDLSRLVQFAEPTHDDVCLDISRRGRRLAEAMASRTRAVTVVDAAPQPTAPADPPAVTVRADARALPYRNGSFTLVTVRFSLYRLPDARQSLREMLRVCGPTGRLIIADLIRRDSIGDRDRIERLRDPGHPTTPSLDELTGLLTDAGAEVRRLDVFTIERPAEPWLAGAGDERAAVQLRQALTAEVDGGPRTGVRPRMIGGELWFTQTLAHVAAAPAGRADPADADLAHSRVAGDY